MKKYSALLLCVILSVAAIAQKAIINFEEKTHNFGKINEDDGKVTYIFSFINKGSSPLVVNRVQASCGCTTPTWSKEPIEPGKKGTITVTYNPLGRPGPFTKTITVYSNASNQEQELLTIKGEVLGKPNPNDNPYPINMGGLLLKSKVVQLNNVDKGKSQIRTLKIQNSNKFSVTPIFEHLPSYLSTSISPETLKPNEEGTITFTFNSKDCAQWGLLSEDLYLTLNGQKRFSDEYKILLVGNVVEDFSKMTLDQKRKAPILEIPERTVNFGVLSANTKRSGKFKIKNNGQNNLEIRSITNPHKELSVRAKRVSIAGGKSTDIVVNLNTKNLAVGEYKKTFTIQTNDPENSFMLLVLSWEIKK